MPRWVTDLALRRGEIWRADLDPVMVSEASKQHAAVIASNDRANATAARLGRGVVTVVPMTTNITTVYSIQVLLSAATSGLAVESKAQGQQIGSVSTERLSHRLVASPAPS
jgi:mRNA interferase MazF